jgi:ribosomal protein L40E
MQEEELTCKSCGATLLAKAKKCSKCGAKVEREKPRYVQKPTIITPDFIAEETWDRQTSPQFLIYHFDRAQFEKASEIDLGELDKDKRKIIYRPVDNEALRKGLVLVPTGYTETTFKQVFEEIDAFASHAYDPCGQNAMLALLVRVTTGSWVLDRFVASSMFDIAGAGKFAPIIPIRGPSQSGKNRLAFVLRLLSYRPYFEMSTYRIPSLYRPLDLWQGTLVLDEADFANTNEKSELIHFLNCRATGTPLSRQNPKNPRLTDTFSNFGLTILTQRRAFDDNATESRALPFYSEVSDKKLPVVETDQMLKEGLALQNKLLFLRMHYYRDVVIEKDQWINDLEDHRLVATLLPLLALSKHEPTLRETITKTAKAVQRLKIEEKANSMDGLLVNYFWEKTSLCLFNQWQPNTHYFLDSVNVENEDGEEKLITCPLTTSELAQHFKWSSQSIRKTINSLNLCSKGLPSFVRDGSKSYRVIFFEAEKLERRLREFVVDYTPKELFKKQSVTGVTLVTLFMHTENEQEEKKIEDALHGKTVTSVTGVTDSSSEEAEPDFIWRVIPEAEPCELCGRSHVEREINDLHGHVILRRCVPCFEKLMAESSTAKWRKVP